MIRRARFTGAGPALALQSFHFAALFGGIAAAALAGCSSSERAEADQDPGSAIISPEAPAPDAQDRPPLFPISSTDSEIGRDRAGSQVVIARIGGRRLIFVADADGKRITALDPDARKELASTALGGAPSQMVIGTDGRLYAALRDKSSITVLEATGDPDGSLRARASMETETEPVALALTADGGTLLVTSGWGHHLEGFSTQRRARTFAVSLPREPRAVALSDDGRTAFVSHMVGGIVSSVDISDINTIKIEINSDSPPSARRVTSISVRGSDFTPPPMVGCGPLPEPVGPPEVARAAGQGFALVRFSGRILGPQVLIRPGDARSRSDGYGNAVGDLPSHVSSIAVLSEASGKPSYTSLNLPALDVAAYVRRHKDCILPRAAAADTSRGSVFIACADTPTLLEVDPEAPDPARAVKRRFPVVQGSSGVAIDAKAREAFVWSSLARTLDVLALGDPSNRRIRNERGRRSASIPLAADDNDDNKIGMGRLLFHTSGDRRIAADGRACASCHPDGRDDGLVWSTPEGPRQPPMLAGRLRETAPYSWTGGHASVKDHITITLKRLRGKGLDDRAQEALSAYLLSLEGPTRKAAREDPMLERGRELFLSPDVGCSMCHREQAAFSDGSLHDVSSSARADRFSVFDTPSLRFVGGTAPYFHDGRYENIRDLLAGTRKTMGMTDNLSVGDISALATYVESL